MPKVTKTKWLAYSLKKGNITKARLNAAGLTSRTIDSLHKGIKLSPTIHDKLRKAYISTQYNKLRKAGFNKKESRSIAYKYEPDTILQAARDRKSYVEEMILRKMGVGTSERAWLRARKSILESIRNSSYKESDWARFAEWYSKHSTKPYPLGVRKVRTLKPTPDIREPEKQVTAAEERELKRQVMEQYESQRRKK